MHKWAELKFQAQFWYFWPRKSSKQTKGSNSHQLFKGKDKQVLWQVSKGENISVEYWLFKEHNSRFLPDMTKHDIFLHLVRFSNTHYFSGYKKLRDGSAGVNGQQRLQCYHTTEQHCEEPAKSVPLQEDEDSPLWTENAWAFPPEAVPTGFDS